MPGNIRRWRGSLLLQGCCGRIYRLPQRFGRVLQKRCATWFCSENTVGREVCRRFERQQILPAPWGLKGSYSSIFDEGVGLLGAAPCLYSLLLGALLVMVSCGFHLALCLNTHSNNAASRKEPHDQVPCHNRFAKRGGP